MATKQDQHPVAILGEENEFEPGAKPQGRLDRVLDVLGTITAAVSGLAYIPLLLLTIFDVALRGFTGHDVGGAVELIQVALAGVVYLAMGSAEVTRTHVRTPILTNRLPDRAANIVRSLSQAIATLFIGFLTVEAFFEAFQSTAADEHVFALINVPIYPARFAIAVGLAFFAVIAGIRAFQTVVLAVRNEAAEEHEYEGID
jgi:TRAP-type C4-dicarboxylate transport system permease small subunit